MESSQNFIHEYIKNLADTLHSQAKRAAQMDHPKMKGDSREESLKQFFREFLPQNTGITTGKAIDCSGKVSQEIDLIIYDKTFPVFRIENLAYVPVDGVIAAIEVKSELNSNTLEDSLRKSMSFSALEQRKIFLENLGGVNICDVKRTNSLTVRDMLGPGFYIYALSGYKSSSSFAETLLKKIKELKPVRLSYPRVIVTPTILSIRVNEYLPPYDNKSDPKLKGALGTYCTDNGTCMFVSDLLHKIYQRLTTLNSQFQVSSASHYFDALAYFCDVINAPTGEKPYMISFDSSEPSWFDNQS
ncbi:DUF6602 domain-containing protein [Pleionea sp. CnH1-48]|uniref:DUF6602 domain-containing protein n=1 Tax=Pleionea sp. CnH1-48 TaxID=2954494 RepID=UPI0020971E82|nr:DUF6602 domain-containing protein [Pleionea sp. CnH1-48]MCO7227534.1 hypothetical protein [Pleionea sp. CnH1-48]